MLYKSVRFGCISDYFLRPLPASSPVYISRSPRPSAAFAIDHALSLLFSNSCFPGMTAKGGPYTDPTPSPFFGKISFQRTYRPGSAKVVIPKELPKRPANFVSARRTLLRAGRTRLAAAVRLGRSQGSNVEGSRAEGSPLPYLVISLLRLRRDSLRLPGWRAEP